MTLPPGTQVYDPAISRRLFTLCAVDLSILAPELVTERAQLQAQLDYRAQRLLAMPAEGSA